jgi:hypothetical protein
MTAAIVAAVAVAAAGVLLAVRAGTSANASHSGPIAVIGAKGKTVAVAPDIALPAAILQIAKPVSETFRVTPSGPLHTSAKIQIPLTARVTSGAQFVFILTSESPNGPWTPLPTRVIRGGWWAEATVTHLSWFTGIKIDLSEALSAVKKFFDDFTGGAYANPDPPTCDNQSAARNNDEYTVTYSPGNTLLWCFGMDNGKRVLKIVNNRRYPLLLTHNLPIVGGTSSLDLFQMVAKLLTPGGTVIFQRLEDDFGADIPAGFYGGVHVNFSAEGQLLSSLEVGLNSLFAIITHFGAKDDPNTIMKVIDTLLSVNSCLSAIGSIAAMLSGCLSPYQLYKALGLPWGLILAPLAASSALIDYMHGALNGAFDQWNNRSQFTILVDHHNSAIQGLLGPWSVHDSSLCIGQALDLQAAQAPTYAPPCSGSAPVGWIRAWEGCNMLYTGSPVCNEWLPFTYTVSADGTLHGTISGPSVYTGENGTILQGLNYPYPYMDTGNTFTLKLADPGLLLGTENSTAPQVSPGQIAYCNYSTISQADQRQYCGA